MSFLFNLYMAVFGYIGFLGYLMIAPLSRDGDTGYIFYSLDFPFLLTIAIALAGGVTLYFVMNWLTKYFVEMGSKEVVENKETRYSFIHSLILLPLLIGIVITTLLNLPIPVFLSLMAPVFSPFSLLWPYSNLLNKVYPLDHSNREFERLNKLHPVLFVLLALTIIGNRLLVAGIYYN